MTRIILLLGFAMLAGGAMMTWGSISAVNYGKEQLLEAYNGFSKEAFVGNMPALIPLIIGLVALLAGMIHRMFTQVPVAALALTLMYFTVSQWMVLRKSFNFEGGKVHMGFYLFLLAPLVILLSSLLTLKKIRSRQG